MLDAHVDRLPVEVDGIFQNRLDHASDRRGAPEIAAGQQDRELVAAQSGHGVGFAQRFAQALRNGLQHQVARVVAERVVDELEPVQVHQEHGHRGSVAPIEPRPLPPTGRLNMTAVREPGHRVLVGQAQDLRLARFDAVQHVIEAGG